LLLANPAADGCKASWRGGKQSNNNSGGHRHRHMIFTEPFVQRTITWGSCLTLRRGNLTIAHSVWQTTVSGCLSIYYRTQPADFYTRMLLI